MSIKSEGTVVVERTLNAPAARVWKALTDADQMRRWYFDLKEFHARPGFEFEFTVEHEGHKYRHLCRVTEAVPEAKIAYTWRYADQPGDSLVTFDLFPEGGKTRLRVTHTGLDTFPKLPAYAPTNFDAGWTEIVGTQLPNFLEGDTSDREICLSREFNAPRELVWEAMSNPKHVTHWWGPRGFTTTTEIMDLRPGGLWKHVMHGPDGVNYPNESVFQQVVKPELISYAHGGSRENGPEVSFIASWTFEALPGNRTRLTVRMVFPTAERRDFVANEFGAIEGCEQTLARLAEHLVTMGSAS